MLKWLSEGSRLLVVAIIFVTSATAQPLSQPDKSITLIVEPDLSLKLGSNVVTRDGIIAALEAATNGDHDERIYVRPDKGVSFQDLLAVAIALTKAGYHKIAMVVAQPDEQR